MKQSKWDSKKLGHFRPVKDCLMMEYTLGEVCIECNKCGRFNSIARRKRKVKKEYGIEYRRIKWRTYFHIFPPKWRRWNKYKTEKIRDEALRRLNKKLDYGMKIFEFRKSERGE